MKLIGEKIVISDKASGYLGNFIEAGGYNKVLILVDENTIRHCLPYAGLKGIVIQIPSGEQHKNIETCRYIWEKMVESQADRHSLMVNLGGGVIGDMGGFCAATYMRGIDFVQVPTTLLAMVDASCGGKLGVDFQGLKNYIGLFSEPKGVFIQPSFLDTLPERQYRSGLAEMMKHGLIAERHHWEALENPERRRMKLLIEDSVKIKLDIVEEDPYEEDQRKLLNFGHTVGHAIESAMLTLDMDILHGEAVALGIIAESYLSLKTGLKPQEAGIIRARIQKHISLPDISMLDADEIFKLMLKDKKNRSGKINCTLLTEIGNAIFDEPVSLDEFRIAFKELP